MNSLFVLVYGYIDHHIHFYLITGLFKDFNNKLLNFNNIIIQFLNSLQIKYLKNF